jgi:hypothetical protein
MPASEVMSKWKHGQLHSGSKKGPVVKSQKQAVAIMLSEKRKGLADGGIPHKQLGGAQIGQAPIASPMPSAVGPNNYSGVGGLVGTIGQTPAGIGSMPAGIGPMNPFIGMASGGVAKGYQLGGAPTGGAPGTYSSQSAFPYNAWGGQLPYFNAWSMMGNPQMWSQFQQAIGGGTPPQTMPGMGQPPAGGLGGLNRQFGGAAGLGGPWLARQEMRGLMNRNMHTGPIISGVGGRTDHHAINVPSGSYVLPAAHVSAMGQGNTLNGMAVLKNMFGSPMKMGHGMGPPKMGAPRLPGSLHAGFSSGGSRHSDTGKPVPIMAAGGEYVLSPQQVARVGMRMAMIHGGSPVDHGHKILDHWVQATHKKYAKTIANLPAPAKT